MMLYPPKGYKGCADVIVSTANMELLPEDELNEGRNVRFYEFDFLNFEDCRVKINGDPNPILLESGDGFTCTSNDMYINSFVIVEEGVHLKWKGKHY